MGLEGGGTRGVLKGSGGIEWGWQAIELNECQLVFNIIHYYSLLKQELLIKCSRNGHIGAQGCVAYVSIDGVGGEGKGQGRVEEREGKEAGRRAVGMRWSLEVQQGGDRGTGVAKG